MRNASTGVSLDALQAGSIPASTPTAVARPIASSISSGVSEGVIETVELVELAAVRATVPPPPNTALPRPLSPGSDEAPCKYPIMKKDKPAPNPAPIKPPIKPTTSDSAMKLNIIVLALAPSAFRIPISFVLSMTDVNSVVIIAMNATRTDMLPIEASKVPVDEVTDSIEEVRDETVVTLMSFPKSEVSSPDTSVTSVTLVATTITPLYVLECMSV